MSGRIITTRLISACVAFAPLITILDVGNNCRAAPPWTIHRADIMEKVFRDTPFDQQPADKLTSVVSHTEDGESWSEPKPVYKPTYIFWKPERRGDRFYATAHVKSRDGKARNIHLITSKDGIEWHMASNMRGGNWESETTIHFLSDTRIVGFLRQKYGSPQASLLLADSPFSEWEERPLTKMHFSGHDSYGFDGVNILVSRAFDTGRKNPHTMIYTFDDTLTKASTGFLVSIRPLDHCSIAESNRC